MARYSKIYDIFSNLAFLFAYILLAAKFISQHNIHELKEVISMFSVIGCAYLLHSRNDVSRSFIYLVLSAFSIGYLYFKEYNLLENIEFDQFAILSILCIIFLVPPFDIISKETENRRNNIIGLTLQYLFIFCVSVSINAPHICSVLSLIIIILVSIRVIYSAREMDALSISKFYSALLLFAYDNSIDIEEGRILFFTLYIVNIIYKIAIEKAEKMLIKNIMYVVTGIAPLFFLHERIEAYIFSIYVLFLHIFLPKFEKFAFYIRFHLSSLCEAISRIECPKYDINLEAVNIRKPKVNLSFAIISIFFILGVILLI